MTKTQKKWIDSASYEQLLSKWRSAPIGDVMFFDETGDYYSKVMRKKKAELNPGGHVAASKNVGWNQP